MNRLFVGLIGAAALALAGCKERIAPHVTPEFDPEVLVADALAADNAARTVSEGNASQVKKVTLTVNNAPGPEQTLEHEVLQQVVALFEKRYPNIRIQFSPWRYTPESFFERAHNRTLTDIVEVDYSQIPPILDLNYAADITDLAASAKQLADVNPELMRHLTRDGRTFGIPGTMNTMALFYNRGLVDAVLSSTLEKEDKPVSTQDDDDATTDSVEDSETTAGQSKRPLQRRNTSTEKRKGRGDDGVARDYLKDVPEFDSRPESIMARYTVPAELLGDDVRAHLNGERVLLAQQRQGGVYYADPEMQPAPARRTRRGEREVQDYYQVQPRQQRQSQQQQQYQQQQYQQQQQQYQQYQQQQYQQQYQQPAPAPQQQRQRRGFFGWLGGPNEPAPDEMPPQPSQGQGAPGGQYYPNDPRYPGSYQGEPEAEPTPRRRATRSRDTASTESKRTAGIDDDVLTTDPVVLSAEAAAKAGAKLAPIIETPGLPQDWDSFIRLAAKLTDHGTTPTYGYAPVLFAKEGGREFTQWAIQAGLRIQIPTEGTAKLDVNTTSAAMVAQFLKDLHWRYDVTPPPSKCYADNLMKMFAEGQIAMMMLPADRTTIDRLVRLGLNVDDLGIAPLPGGPANRDHLGFGSCYIINSQLDSERRAAALQWLLFQLDPEVIRLQRITTFREQAWTGVPEVPLFQQAKYQELLDSLRPYHTLPIFPDYYRTVASDIALEPPYFTGRLYEALAEGVRPIVENRSSDPMQAITYVGVDFEKKYLQNAPTPAGIRRYLNMIPGL